MRASLALVEPDPAAKPETAAQRIRRLQAEARQAVRDHTRDLSADLIKAAETASAIADGGDIYPAGVRELARAVVNDIESRVQTLEAIVARVL